MALPPLALTRRSLRSVALHLDPASGDFVALDRYADRSLGARTRPTFHAIHVGTVFGEPTRLLAFVTSLLGATFPITGLLMWWRKRARAAPRPEHRGSRAASRRCTPRSCSTSSGWSSG